MFPEVNVYIALLACGVAFLGITMTLTTGDQFRNVVLKYGKPTFTQILPSVTTNGVFLGGVMMWSVHMIGFVSMTWKDNDGNVVPIHFNTAVCLLGLIFSVIMSSVGGFIAGKDKLYAKSKAEILDHFVAIVSADNLLNYSEYEVLVLLMTKELRYKRSCHVTLLTARAIKGFTNLQCDQSLWQRISLIWRRIRTIRSL